MSDFEEWWYARAKDCNEPMYGMTHAGAAWRYQQERIYEMQDEVEALREALETIAWQKCDEAKVAREALQETLE